MKLLGHTEITTIEEPDHLQFVVTREGGWIDLLVPPTILATTFILACLFHHFFYAALSILGLFALVAYYLNGPVTKLFVSQNQLIARGNLDRTFTNEVKVTGAEVKYLGYSMGPGENSPAGLYADCGWLKQTCLLPGLNKRDANAIAEAIRHKFPTLEHGDTSPDSLIFGPKSDVITLDLQSSSSSDPNAPSLLDISQIE